MFGIRTRREIKRLRHFLKPPRKERCTRRADHSIVPIIDSPGTQTVQARHINHFALLCSLEANKSTCCISISNERQKSRSSLILFRGRILTCIYGKRGISYHSFGSGAFQNALLDLSNPQTKVSAQALSEEMALSCSTIFLGERQKQFESQTLSQFVELVCEQLSASRMPGCLVFKDDSGQSHYIVYFANGEISGFYSFKDGWIANNSRKNVLRYAAKAQSLRGQSYELQLKSIEALYDQTFSLSTICDGIADRLAWIVSKETVNSLKPMQLHFQEPTLRDTFRLDPDETHRRDMRVVANYSMRHSASRHSHFVDPARMPGFMREQGDKIFS